MKHFGLAIFLCAVLAAPSAFPKGSTPSGSDASAPAAAPQATPNESQLIEHGHYTNKQGQSVHSPAHSRDDRVPAGASAQCRDGSYSFSRHHSGTCSRHGGVANWLQ